MRRLSSALVALWLLALAGATWTRATVWQSNLSLWTDATKKTPMKPRPWINLGLALEGTGDIQQALSMTQRAFSLAFQPQLTRYTRNFTYVATQTNIAKMLAQHGQEAAAERILRQVIEVAPSFPHGFHNLAVLYTRTGRCLEAEPLSRWAASLDASFPRFQCSP